jgi:subtilisin-like proprotein convertase family protein
MKKLTAVLVLSCLTSFVWAQAEVFNIDDYPDYAGCNAIMHDDNGGLAPYSADANNEILICSADFADQVNLFFIGFHLAPGDIFYIYDGFDTTAPLIGAFSGESLLFQTISSSLGCLTVKFIANGDAEVGDFSARIICGTPCDFPVAELQAAEAGGAFADTVKICPGESVDFDASNSSWTPGATANLTWSFGDGTQLTNQNTTISHAFGEPGGYRVRLGIEDSNGCQSLNIPEVIVLVSTPYVFELYTSSDSYCLGNDITIGNQGGAGIESPNGYSETWVEDLSVVFDNGIYIPDNQGCLESEIVFTQFGGDVIDQVSDITQIYFNMEHSFVGDITISVICPSGQVMSIFPEAGGSGTYLGEPIDDPGNDPGIGYDYSFTPTATSGTWMEYIAGGGASPIPAGEYEAEDSFDDLIGCPMNGTWTLEICDIVGADDGYLFNFGIQFGGEYYPEALQFTPSVGSGCDSSYWVNPSQFSSIGGNCDWAVFSPTVPGNYTFEYEVVNDFGCVFSDTISVEVLPGPLVSVNDIEAYCNTPQELVAVIQNATPGTPYAYSWSPATGLSSPVIASPDVISLSETTTYTVTVTQIGLDNCQGIAQATVYVLDGGCADPIACNFDPNVSCNNGTCIYPGCDDLNACNYNADAGCNDGSCIFIGSPCDDGLYYTYNDVITENCNCFGTVYNYGGVTSNSTTWCPGAVVNPLTCSEPFNLSDYDVQWYYTDGFVNCPFANSTAGWLPLSGANSLVFTPSEFSGSRTFACFITPALIDAVPGWADGCVYYSYYDFTAQIITGNPNITPFSNYLYAVSQIAGHSYFWSVTNGVIVSGQGTNAIQVLWGANGPYDVTLTEGDGICESTTSLFSVTSVNELYEGVIQVWPNPTRDVLQIEVAPEWLGSSWRITNLLGQEVARPVLSQSLTSIETSHWAEGVYLLQNEAAGVKMKIVKN